MNRASAASVVNPAATVLVDSVEADSAAVASVGAVLAAAATVPVAAAIAAAGITRPGGKVTGTVKSRCEGSAGGRRPRAPGRDFTEHS